MDYKPQPPTLPIRQKIKPKSYAEVTHKQYKPKYNKQIPLPSLNKLPAAEQPNSKPVITTTIPESIPQISTQQKEVAENTIDMLAASVMLPTEAKGFGWLESLTATAKLFSSTANRTRLIQHLQAKTFDTSNKSFFDLLAAATEEATNANDIDSLMLIAALCQCDKYKDGIRIADENVEIADKASTLLTENYRKSITDSHLSIQTAEKKNRDAYNNANNAFSLSVKNLIVEYKQTVNGIIEDYDTTCIKEEEKILTLQEGLNNFSNLQPQIRNKIQTTLAKIPIIVPTNNPIHELHKTSKTKTQLNRIERLSKLKTNSMDNAIPLLNRPVAPILPITNQ